MRQQGLTVREGVSQAKSNFFFFFIQSLHSKHTQRGLCIDHYNFMYLSCQPQKSRIPGCVGIRATNEELSTHSRTPPPLHIQPHAHAHTRTQMNAGIRVCVCVHVLCQLPWKSTVSSRMVRHLCECSAFHRTIAIAQTETSAAFQLDGVLTIWTNFWDHTTPVPHSS